MTTIEDLEASVRLANIAAARTCLAAALISLHSAERQLLRSVSSKTPRGPMYDLSDGLLRIHARTVANIAADVDHEMSRLAAVEARQ